MTISESPYYQSGKNVLPSGDAGVHHLHTKQPLMASISDVVADDPERFSVKIHRQSVDKVKVTGLGHPRQEGAAVVSPKVLFLGFEVVGQASDELKIDPNSVDLQFALDIDGDVGYLYSIPPGGKAQEQLKHLADYPRIVEKTQELDTKAGGGLYLLYQGKVYTCKVEAGDLHYLIDLEKVKDPTGFTGHKLGGMKHEKKVDE